MNKISDNIKRSRVKDELARRIVSGEFAFGSRFPGLNDLCGELGVSYVTVSKAVKMLADEGYLRCRPGVGYFVCYAEPGSEASKEVNIVSTPGYYREHKADFESGIDGFRRHGWQVRLLLGHDLYEFMGQLNSPHAYSIITAFNVNWERFSANFGHLVKRTVVLGRLSGNPEITSIVCDEYETVRLCMDRFAGLGRKRVALVSALPQSELESLRIAAWRKRVLASGLSMEWMRRHLLSFDLETQPDRRERIIALCRQWLRDNRKDTDAVILPASPNSFLAACRDENVKIPDGLAVISIGLQRDPAAGIEYVDNNYRGHFQAALEILEDRFLSDRIIPGSWYFCPPGGIVSGAKASTDKINKRKGNRT